jgi:hypothetical protein
MKYISQSPPALRTLDWRELVQGEAYRLVAVRDYMAPGFDVGDVGIAFSAYPTRAIRQIGELKMEGIIVGVVSLRNGAAIIRSLEGTQWVHVPTAEVYV